MQNMDSLRYRIQQVVKVELPSATNWRDFIYCFAIAVSSLITSMMRKIYVYQANLLINASNT